MPVFVLVTDGQRCYCFMQRRTQYRKMLYTEPDMESDAIFHEEPGAVRNRTKDTVTVIGCRIWNPEYHWGDRGWKTRI